MTRGCPQDGRRPESFHFLCFFATSRIAAYLQCKRPRTLIIPCKNEGILFRESTAEGRRKDGAFSPFVGVPWGPPRPPKEVLKIRGGHQNSRELESLHSYGVPWPHRRGQKSFKKDVVKLTHFFFSKSRLQNPCRSTARIAAFGGVIVIASTGSIANHRSP